MRFLIVLALCCTCVFGQQAAGGGTQLDESKWSDVRAIIEESLVQLKDEQGHNLQLKSIQNVQHKTVSGSSYTVNALVNAPGSTEDVACTLTIWVQTWANFREFETDCAGTSYRAVKGTKSA